MGRECASRVPRAEAARRAARRHVRSRGVAQAVRDCRAVRAILAAGHTGAVNNAASSAPARGAVAPGPKGHLLLGMLPEFRSDRLGFLVDTARALRWRGALPGSGAVGVPGDRSDRRQTRAAGQRRQLRPQDAQRGCAARHAGQRPADDDRPGVVAEQAARPAQLSQAAPGRLRRHHGGGVGRLRRAAGARGRRGRVVRCRPRAVASHPPHPWTLSVRARVDRRRRRGRRRAAGRPPPHHGQARVADPAAGRLSDAPEPALSQGAAGARQASCCR